MKTSPRPLRVGFDMDGVLLYNPTRVIRPFISSIKRTFLKEKKLKFYYPKKDYEKLFWRFVHKSSIYNAPGLKDISSLVREGKIEAYLITARYSFLGPSVKKWIKKNKLENTFKEVIYNSKDEQPHLFKERMIKKLKLDIYVEDNYDVVEYIATKTGAQIVWIYNMFDRHIQFANKAPTLQKAINQFVKKK